MTGFGRAEHATNDYLARVEITSVNRKQADIVFSLPRELGEIEPPLRKRVLKVISRGRVNVAVNLEAAHNATDTLSFDPTRAQALEAAYIKLSDLLDRRIVPDSHDFLRAPGVFSFQDSGYDPALCLEAIEPALAAALEKLVEMRNREGNDLKNDLIARISILEQETSAIKEKSPQVVARQRELLHQRLREAEIDLDLNDERLLKEVALFAERCDISEETTRLASHFAKFLETLALEEPVGRTLDFLCQELNREFNTIGSKANDSGIGQHVVKAKTELEKIREQVQNIE